MRLFEDAFFQQTEGRLSGREWASIERVLTPWKETALFRGYWANRSFMYSDGFVSYVNKLKGSEPFRLISAKPDETNTSEGAVS